MKHPLDWVPVKNRLPLFWLFLVGTAIILLLFQPMNHPLVTVSAPSGIISLQLAWTPESAQGMLNSWYANARQFAALGLGFDYLFMPVYALALALGTLLAAGRHPGWFARLGSWAAYAAFLAAVLDGLENFGQFQELFKWRVDLAFIIAVVASTKFTLIGLSLAYGLAGWLWRKWK
jgi:hypothetical protein